MAKLPDAVCWRTVEVRCLFQEGQKEEALEKTRAYLREGVSTPPFLAFVADLLEADPQRLNTPRKQFLRSWIEIGEAYEELRAQGLNREQAIERLMERGQPAANAMHGKRNVERIIRAFEAAREPQ
jgi:uncharacterized protein YoaH (UPF0181 family)